MSFIIQTGEFMYNCINHCNVIIKASKFKAF